MYNRYTLICYLFKMSSSDDFFKGLIFGAVVGVTAGILLAPKSGAETRADIKRFTEETGDKAEKYYRKAKRQLVKKVADLREAGKNIDWEGYKRLVDKVVNEVKKDGEVTSEVAKEIGFKLNNDWKEIKGAVV